MRPSELNAWINEHNPVANDLRARAAALQWPYNNIFTSVLAAAEKVVALTLEPISNPTKARYQSTSVTQAQFRALYDTLLTSWTMLLEFKSGPMAPRLCEELNKLVFDRVECHRVRRMLSSIPADDLKKRGTVIWKEWRNILGSDMDVILFMHFMLLQSRLCVTICENALDVMQSAAKKIPIIEEDLIGLVDRLSDSGFRIDFKLVGFDGFELTAIDRHSASIVACSRGNGHLELWNALSDLCESLDVQTDVDLN